MDKAFYKKVLENSPESIYVADNKGITIYVNPAFERLSGISKEEVIGRSVYELEKEGYFRPSATRLVLEEKKPVTVIQVDDDGKDFVVSGVPVFDDKGNIDFALTNSMFLEERQELYEYIKKKESDDLFNTDSSVKPIGDSKEMKDALKLINQIKDTNSTVLLSGESGVGKGVLARYIHNNSNRSENKLIEINCGAIPDNLLESELFGYESGAFTGASTSGKKGLIEMADGGTLMLDEISELPMNLQVKLLKVIQDREIMRIGGKTPIPIDTRFIAASNRNLADCVREGKFRADLYYRLCVIPINIAPLKDRREDIRTLSVHFLDEVIKKYNKRIEYTNEFINGLMEYDWPGNVRELENYLERKVLTCVGNKLSSDDLYDINSNESVSEIVKTFADEYQSFDEAVEKLEEKIIKDAYEKYKSSYKVAEKLGISQTKANRKINKYIGTDSANDSIID